MAGFFKQSRKESAGKDAETMARMRTAVYSNDLRGIFSIAKSKDGADTLNRALYISISGGQYPIACFLGRNGAGYFFQDNERQVDTLSHALILGDIKGLDVLLEEYPDAFRWCQNELNSKYPRSSRTRTELLYSHLLHSKFAPVEKPRDFVTWKDDGGETIFKETMTVDRDLLILKQESFDFQSRTKTTKILDAAKQESPALLTESFNAIKDKTSLKEAFVRLKAEGAKMDPNIIYFDIESRRKQTLPKKDP